MVPGLWQGEQLSTGCALSRSHALLRLCVEVQEGLVLRIKTAPGHANTGGKCCKHSQSLRGGWSSALFPFHPNSLNFPYPSLFLSSSQSTPQKNESQRT